MHANGLPFRYTTGNGQREVKPEELLDALDQCVRQLRSFVKPHEIPPKAWQILMGEELPKGPSRCAPCYRAGRSVKKVGTYCHACGSAETLC